MTAPEEVQRYYAVGYSLGYDHEDNQIETIGQETTDVVEAVTELNELNKNSRHTKYFLVYRDAPAWKKM